MERISCIWMRYVNNAIIIIPTEIVNSLVWKSDDLFSDFVCSRRKVEHKNGERVRQIWEAATIFRWISLSMSLVNNNVDSTKNIPNRTVIDHETSKKDWINPVFLEWVHHFLSPSTNEINIPKLTIVNPTGIKNLIGL